MRNIAEIIEDDKNGKKLSQTERQIAVAYIQGKYDAVMKISNNSKETRWIPVSERYPKIEDEYKYFLVTDDKGKVSIRKFFISLDEEPQPYFSGLVNVIAWMPLPKAYKAESEDKE